MPWKGEYNFIANLFVPLFSIKKEHLFVPDGTVFIRADLTHPLWILLFGFMLGLEVANISYETHLFIFK
jgi:hypothetical protein